MDTPNFRLPSKILWLITITVYGINVGFIMYIIDLLVDNNPHILSYIIIGGVIGFAFGSYIHVRVFLGLIYGGNVDAVIFLFSILLVPLYPSTLGLLYIYDQAVESIPVVSNYFSLFGG